MKYHNVITCSAILAVLWLSALQGHGAEASLRAELLTSEALDPVYATAPEGETRLYVVERAGRIRILEQGAFLQEAFLDITNQVTACGERGLLGMAFHPDYGNNGQFFVYYTTTLDSVLMSRISRFHLAENPAGSVVADPESESILLEFMQPFSNHNAGMIAFGPQDGYLYIASGDGGSSNDPQDNAQRLDSLLGKMLRIDVDAPPDPGLAYAIPPTNPFVDTPGARPEIWAYGLRNPWRFSFDRRDGAVYIADVGQNAWEEVNYQPAHSLGGENYGWRIFEGSHCNSVIPAVTEEDCAQLASDVVMPVHEYPNPEDGRSITGGYVYRGGAMPEWNGVYFFTDYLSHRLWSFQIEEGVRTAFQEHTATVNPERQTLRHIVSFGEDAAGELYLVSLFGEIHRLTRNPDVAPAYQMLLADFDALDSSGDGVLSLEEARVAIPDMEARVFDGIDRNKDGVISRAELRSATTHGVVHGLDQNANGRIDLPELLRVIQFYNVGALHCASDSEDGYAPGPGPQDCLRYPADLALDWRIDLGEVLRVVQFYNTGKYRYCPDAMTEDGYCIADAG